MTKLTLNSTILLLLASIFANAQTTLLIENPNFIGRVKLVESFGLGRIVLDTAFTGRLELKMSHLFDATTPSEIVLEPWFYKNEESYYNTSVLPLLKDSLCKITLSKDRKTTYSGNFYYNSLQLLTANTFDNEAFSTSNKGKQRNIIYEQYMHFYAVQNTWGAVPLMGLAQALYSDKSSKLKDKLYYTVDSLCKTEPYNADIFWQDFICPQIQYAHFPEYIEAQDTHKHLRKIYFKEIDKWTLIDFWATWCKPCISQLKKYNTTWTSDEIHIITVSIDSVTAVWSNFIKNNDNFSTFENLWDDGRIKDELEIGAVPFTLLIGPKGIVRTINPSFEEISNLIKNK